MCCAGARVFVLLCVSFFVVCVLLHLEASVHYVGGSQNGEPLFEGLKRKQTKSWVPHLEKHSCELRMVRR